MSRIINLCAERQLRQRRPRVHNKKYLDVIRGLPCVLSGRPAEAAHVRYADPEYDKRYTGMREKPDDKWTLPLCPVLHRLSTNSQHQHNEREWWARLGIADPLAICAELWEAFETQSEPENSMSWIVAMARPEHQMYREMIARILSE